MRYYLIAGEASGDLHASHLMQALKQQDPQAKFRFFGGELMTAVGGERVKHYRELAYMGFVPVLLHLPTILRNMKRCKKDISMFGWRLSPFTSAPDASFSNERPPSVTPW